MVMKADFLDRLKAGQPPETEQDRKRREAARDRLLERLRIGSDWLREVNERLCREEDVVAALGSRYAEALDQWESMERMVRELYGWESCVFGLGNRCPPDAVVACQTCSALGTEEQA